MRKGAGHGYAYGCPTTPRQDKNEAHFRQPARWIHGLSLKVLGVGSNLVRHSVAGSTGLEYSIKSVELFLKLFVVGFVDRIGGLKPPLCGLSRKRLAERPLMVISLARNSAQRGST